MEKKVLIVDDDPFTAHVVEKMFKNNFPDITVVGKTGSIKETLNVVNELHPDFMILDVQLEDGTAFELLQQIEILDFKIIFMSSNHSYLEKSMQFAAVDFLLKPFDENDFVFAIEKLLTAYQDEFYQKRIEVMFSNIDSNPKDWKLVLTKDFNSVAVNIKDIIYGESISGGSNFILESGEKHFIPKPLRRYETLLAPFAFYRCHPLYVINIRQIQKIDSENLEIEFFSGNKVPFEEWRQNNLKNKYKGILDTLF